MASLKDDMDEYNEVVQQAQNIDKPGIGEGIAMGFMALGDAYGGAFGGQTDFLGSYLKGKKERERLARAKKLTPYQFAKLKKSEREEKDKRERQDKRDRLSRDNTKSQMLGRLYKFKKEREDFNAKLAELNRNRRPNDQIAPRGVSEEEKALLDLYKQNFGPIGTKAPPSLIKPTPKVEKKSKITPRKISFTESDQQTIDELGFSGTDQDKRNSLRHYRSILRKNQGLGDRAKEIALGEIVDFSTMSEADKDKFKKVTAKNNRIGEVYEAKKEQEFKKYGRTKSDEVLKNVNLWENRRETINKALFEYLSHQTKGQIFGNFSLDDLVVSGDKVFYKKKYTDKDGQVKVHQLLIEPPSIEGVAFGENVIEYQKRGIPGRAKFFQAMAALKNQALNKLSGAAVSTQEYERFQRQFEGDKLKSPAALINALKSLELEHKKDLLKATDEFNRQFRLKIIVDSFYQTRLIIY